MKLSPILLAALISVTAFAATDAELGQVRSVYLLSMGNGMDQYLANQLTAQNVFQVVTDPQKAEAILTDRIGVQFEMQLDELYPPPPEEVEGEQEEDLEGEAAEEAVEQEKPIILSSFGRGKGNLFLVGRESRRVIWSTYDRPKNFTPEQLNNAAARIVKRLQKILAGQQPVSE